MAKLQGQTALLEEAKAAVADMQAAGLFEGDEDPAPGEYLARLNTALDLGSRALLAVGEMFRATDGDAPNCINRDEMLRILSRYGLGVNADEESPFEALRRSKAYVHDRLDAAGVDPHHEQNALNGCRIGARLDDILKPATTRSQVLKPDTYPWFSAARELPAGSDPVGVWIILKSGGGALAAVYAEGGICRIGLRWQSLARDNAPEQNFTTSDIAWWAYRPFQVWTPPAPVGLSQVTNGEGVNLNGVASFSGPKSERRSGDGC